MTTRILPSLRALGRPRNSPSFNTTRTFRTAAALRDAATASTAAPVRKPVGAFRGGLFGFLLGSVVAGAGTFYYVLEEYRVSNELMTEDIYALQAAVQRVHSKVIEMERKENP